MSKLFEHVLLSLFGESLASDNLQFGFKKDSSCSHALFTFGETVKYFTSRGSKIYSVSLDASKAFDKVLHHGLFIKMLKKGISPSFVQLLYKWYGNLCCCVSWNGILSESFKIKFFYCLVAVKVYNNLLNCVKLMLINGIFALILVNVKLLRLAARLLHS